MNTTRSIVICTMLVLYALLCSAARAEVVPIPLKQRLPEHVITTTADDPAWTHSINRPGAASISIVLDDLDLGDDWLLLLSNRDAKQIQVIDQQTTTKDGRLVSKTFAGSQLRLELIALNDQPAADPQFLLDQIQVEFTDPDSSEAVQARIEAASRTFRAEPIPDDGRVVYGTDDRIEVFEEQDARIREMADSVALIFSRNNLRDNGDGTFTLLALPWTTSGASGGPICEDQRFYGQPVFGFCTGFLVGDDLIATAGHCAEQLMCGDFGFVFDYQYESMEEGPALTLNGSDIYSCAGIEVLEHVGDLDHALIRLDRRIRNREPLPIARADKLSNDKPLTVIGHPLNLPKKIAGNAVVKNAAAADEWFQANLDTFGGNSGSPVINMDTMVVEGILVRGAPDLRLRQGDTCLEVNEVPDTGNTGTGLMFEEVSKTAIFAEAVPENEPSRGRIWLDREYYSTNSVVAIEVFDGDLVDSGQVQVLVTKSSSGGIAVVLDESGDSPGRFFGSLQLGAGSTSPSLEVQHQDLITATYQDADDGTGQAASVSASAEIDSIPPMLLSTEVTDSSGVTVDLQIVTDEPSILRIDYGVECGTYFGVAEQSLATTHTIKVRGLLPETLYHYELVLTDRAGNTGIDDNIGSCFEFVTTDKPDYFTELFTEESDLMGQCLQFVPDQTSSQYTVCRTAVTQLPIAPGGQDLGLLNDDWRRVTVAGGSVRLYGDLWRNLYIGSNGYITFGEGDETSVESFEAHFALPRISATFDDLDPAAGGQVLYQELDDQVVVTWLEIPERLSFGTTSGKVTAQVQLFFDGRIVITTLENERARDGLTGLSAGGGVPDDFVASDLSAYEGCPASSTRMRFVNPQLACGDDAVVELRGANLTSPTLNITFLGSSNDIENIEVPRDIDGVYRASVATTSDTSGPEDGILTIDDGQEVFANVGALAGASVFADCQAVILESVNLIDVGSVNALLRIKTSEESFVFVDYGLDCGDLTNTVVSDPSTEHVLELTGLEPETRWYYQVRTQDPAGNESMVNNNGDCFSILTGSRANWLAEQFLEEDNDLTGLSVTFTPNGSPGGYSACVETLEATEFPFPIDGATALELGDDDAKEITLDPPFTFHGQPYDRAFVSSNGYVVFGERDDDHTESLEDHFALPRIAGVFDDLDPTLAGQILVENQVDKLVITFNSVAEFGSSDSTQSFQIALHHDGRIGMTWLEVGASDGLAGLSPGRGLPADFIETDLSGIVGCDERPAELFFSRGSYRCSDTIKLSLLDSSMSGSNQTTARITSDSDEESITLNEVSTGLFEAEIQLTNASATAGDGVLQAAAGGILNATWPLDGTAAEAFALVDCTQPGVVDFDAFEVGEDFARVRILFDEPVSMSLMAGTSCGSGESTASTTVLREHELYLESLSAGVEYFCQVTGIDEAGNVLTSECYSFRTAGTPTPTPTPNEIAWSFEEDREGWGFGNPAAFSSVDFTHDSGALQMATFDNTNSFGYWESPIVDFEDIGVMATAGETVPLEIRWSVSTNVTSRELVPAIRFRASTLDFSRTDALVIESTSAGELSPTTDPSEHVQLANMPADAAGLRLDFDVLSFDPSNASEAVLRLEQVVMRPAALNAREQREEAFYNFADKESNGFTPRDTGVLATPVFVETDRGLRIAAAAEDPGDEVIFGYWGLESDLAMEAGRVYNFAFTVTTDAGEGQTEDVPAFRLRVNDEALQASTVTNIESLSATTARTLPPSSAESREYQVLYLVPETAGGRTAILSFDWIFAPESLNDPTIGVVLQELHITSTPYGE